MNEIINVNLDTETVSARDLYEALEIKTAYKDWFPRICEYGFTEGTDFNSLKNERVQIEGDRKIKREVLDANISIDMAKQICMIQRSEKGKQIRQYFIDLEKAWNTPEQIMARALKMADTTINSLKLKIEEQKPLVEFANHIGKASDCIDMNEFAKMLKKENIENMGRNRLFEWLRTHGILMSNNLPYQRYMEGGYFKVVETIKHTAYGDKLFSKCLVTGKIKTHMKNQIINSNTNQ